MSIWYNIDGSQLSLKMFVYGSIEAKYTKLFSIFIF